MKPRKSEHSSFKKILQTSSILWDSRVIKPTKIFQKGKGKKDENTTDIQASLGEGFGGLR